MVLVLLIILFFALTLVSLQNQLVLTSYSETPITQLFNFDDNNNTMTIITGTKSFIYNKETNTINNSALNNNPSLSTAQSITIQQLSDGTIAIACNSIGITILNKQGEEISRYTNDHFDEKSKCSLLRLPNDRFVFCYLLNATYVIDFIEYDPLSKAMTKEIKSFSFQASDSPMISCESFMLKQIVFCVYLSQQVEGVYFSYNHSMFKRTILNEDSGNALKLVKINESYIGLFILNKSHIEGIIYKYNENKKLIEIKKNGQSLMPTSDLNYEVFDVRVIKNSDDILPLNVAIFIIACKKTCCLVEKFNIEFQELSYLVQIPLNGNNDYIGVSLGLFNQYELCIVIRQNYTNYLMQYNLNSCLNESMIYLATNQSILLEQMNSFNFFNSIEIMILSTSFGLINYLSLKSRRGKLEENSKYPLDKVVFTPVKSGIYSMQYLLFYNDMQINSKCKLKFYICYKACKTCSVYGTEDDMKCIDCEDGYYSSIDKPNQCYDKKSVVCGEANPYWIEKEKKCVSSCELYNLYTDSNEYICLSDCGEGKILDKITNECLYQESFNSRMDKYIKEIDRYVVELYNHFPTQKKENYTMNIYNTSSLPENYTIKAVSFDSFNISYLSTVYLKHCETILKIEYGFESTTPLLIAIFDYKSNGQITNSVMYSVYSIEGIPLDLSLCEDRDIIIVTPIIQFTNPNITTARLFNKENIDVYNSNDPFFNDICYIYSTKQHTDIPLSMRIQKYYLNHHLLCNPGCKLLYLDFDNMFVVCSCSNNIYDSYASNYSLLLDQSNTKLRRSNMEIIKCSHLVFNTKNLSLNYGNFITLCLNIIQLINAIYFFVNGMKAIENTFHMRIRNYRSNSFKFTRNNSNYKGIEKKRNLVFNQISYEESLEESSIIKKEVHFNTNNDINKFAFIRTNGEHNSLLNQCNLQQKNKDPSINNNNNNILIVPNHKFKTKISRPKILKTFQENKNIYYQNNIKNSSYIRKQKKTSHQNNDYIKPYNPNIHHSVQPTKIDKPHQIYLLSELYELPNDEFLSKDIGFGFYYCSYLQYLQPIMRTFFFANLFKTRIIRISLFFFYLIATMSLNGLFFYEKYLIKSYLTNGDINFVFNLPVVINGFCFGLIIRICFNFLLSSKFAMHMLKNKQAMYSFEEKNRLIRNMKIRIIVYYILQMIIGLFCWYYISVFCAVYPKIQLTWIICALESILINELFPFLLCGLLGVLAVISTRYHLKWMKYFTHFISLMS